MLKEFVLTHLTTIINLICFLVFIVLVVVASLRIVQNPFTESIRPIVGESIDCQINLGDKDLDSAIKQIIANTLEQQIFVADNIYIDKFRYIEVNNVGTFNIFNNSDGTISLKIFSKLGN